MARRWPAHRTADLTVAISNAGGLGPLAAAALSPEAIHNEIAEVRKRTSKPFNVNLFVLGQPKADPQQVARALELLAPIREELGLPPGQATRTILPGQRRANWKRCWKRGPRWRVSPSAS